MITSGLGVQYQTDLMHMQNLSKENDNFKYVLVTIDCFSRFLYLYPLKNKTSQGIIRGFKEIFKDRIPHVIQSDQGSEFTNRAFQTFLKENNVRHFHTNSELKASICERVIRTVKQVLYRYFTHNKTLNYVSVLSEICRGYNTTFHVAIGCPPADVDYSNQEQIFHRLYGDMTPKKPKLTIGTPVRISKSRGNFVKSALASWTEEIFFVSQCRRGDPPTYQLKDYHGEVIDGRFQREELQPITKNNNIYNIEKILSTRKKGKKTQYLVKWLGYPSKFNSWVSDLYK